MCLCGYQPECGARALGAAALPCLMALEGLCTAKKIAVIYSYHPGFYCMPLAGSSAEAMLCQIRNFSPVLEQLLYLQVFLLLGAMGEDADRLGRAALAGMLTAFNPLYWALPTSAWGNQKRRVYTPQYTVARLSLIHI